MRIPTICVCALLTVGAGGLYAQSAIAPTSGASYTLGPEDELIVRVLDLNEIGDKPYRVDLEGNLNLPLAGRVHVTGLTLEEVERELLRRLKQYLQEPVLTVSVSSYGSQPVTVVGAVGKPGIHQIRGRKRLLELLAEVGGIKTDAGNSVRVTRTKASGSLPLQNVVVDATTGFSVGEISLKSLMEARDPNENIEIRPNDLISVPRADLIYVIGSVRRSGGFPLNERESISVLQALAMAEGLERTAAPGAARILRSTPGAVSRSEIAVDISKILSGKGQDQPLLPNDILFIPNSAARSLTIRGIEAAIQTVTGIAIWRR